MKKKKSKRRGKQKITQLKENTKIKINFNKEEIQLLTDSVEIKILQINEFKPESNEFEPKKIFEKNQKHKQFFNHQ
jgi:hypothetical protein